VRKLRFVVILLAVVWLVAELAAIPVAGRLIAQRVSAQTHDIAAVHAKVGTFPIVTRLLLTGRVNNATVTLDKVVRLNLTFAQVSFQLEGVQLDKSALFGQRKARITAIQQGTVTATIDVQDVSRIARAFSPSRAPRVTGRTLLLGAASFQLSSDIMPCDPDARIDGNQIVLSCTVNNVPPVLLESAQRG
jgi:hypothetical protein